VSAAGAKIGRVSLGPHASRNDAGVVVLDEHCAIPESAAGYHAALGSLERGDAGVVIVPAAVDVPSSAVRLLHDRLRAGAMVLVESGSTFGDAGSNGFRSHRVMLREHFGIEVERPMPLWPSATIPYVHYSWPLPAMVRDYGRAVVLPEQDGVIARVNGLPVALTRRFRAGTLIFLGSPLGPPLLFGDREARAWLTHIIWMSPVDTD
jgi:hypothetical protein